MRIIGSNWIGLTTSFGQISTADCPDIAFLVTCSWWILNYRPPTEYRAALNRLDHLRIDCQPSRLKVSLCRLPIFDPVVNVVRLEIDAAGVEVDVDDLSLADNGQRAASSGFWHHLSHRNPPVQSRQLTVCNDCDLFSQPGTNQSRHEATGKDGSRPADRTHHAQDSYISPANLPRR